MGLAGIGLVCAAWPSPWTAEVILAGCGCLQLLLTLLFVPFMGCGSIALGFPFAPVNLVLLVVLTIQAATAEHGSAGARLKVCLAVWVGIVAVLLVGVCECLLSSYTQSVRMTLER